MSFTFICPNCNQKLEAEDEWLGMEAECPGCGKKITVQKTIILRKVNEPACEDGEEQGTVLSTNETITCAPIPDRQASAIVQESALDPELSRSMEKKNKVLQAPCDQPQSRYHLVPGTVEEKSEEVPSVQELPSSKQSASSPSEGTPVPPDVAPNKKEPVKGDAEGRGGMVGLLVVIGIVVWLGWLGLSHWPRLSFWLLAPVIGVIVFANSGKIPKLVTVLLCAGIVFWGWKVHHLRHSASHKVKDGRSIKVKDGREVNLTVMVKRNGSDSEVYESWWEHGCEYRLFANGKCIASQQSSLMVVYFFDVKVKIGTKLYAELRPINSSGEFVGNLKSNTHFVDDYDGTVGTVSIGWRPL